MADPHWTSYVGMFSGLIGTLTGIAGLIMGYVSYKKSNQIKKLDLRIELKRSIEDTTLDSKKLLEQMEKAFNSRIHVASATGRSDSGWKKKWKEEFEANQTKAYELANKLTEENTNYDQLDPKGLENKLIELHKIKINIHRLFEKYSETLAEDNEDRKHIREAMLARLK